MSPKHRMPRLDPRDVVVVRDMLRFRALVTEHVARRTGNSIDTAYQTLARLTRLGLVQKEPNWIRGTELWTATQRGARAVKSRRKVSALWPGGLPHDLALVDLADQLLLDDPRATWRTEREIVGERARARRRGEPSGTGHQPDGLLVVAGAASRSSSSSTRRPILTRTPASVAGTRSKSTSTACAGTSSRARSALASAGRSSVMGWMPTSTSSSTRCRPPCWCARGRSAEAPPACASGAAAGLVTHLVGVPDPAAIVVAGIVVLALWHPPPQSEVVRIPAADYPS